MTDSTSTAPTWESATPAVANTAFRRRGNRSRGDRERSAISEADLRSPSVRWALRAIHLMVFIALLIAGVGPLLWLLKAALSTPADILSDPMGWFPSGTVQWSNLSQAWGQARVGLYLGNTLVIALGSLIANLFVSVTAAYVLSVLRPRWGNLLSGAILATLFIPGVVSLVPMYLTILALPPFGWNLINTYWAVWLPAASSAFNVLVLKRFFDALPRDLFDAARIDGAGKIRVLMSIVLPLSKPIIGVVSLLTVISAWKEFVWPLLVLPNPAVQPLSVALANLTLDTPINIVMAALFIAVTIPIGLFLVFQRQFLQGVSLSSGVKG